jgi:hypothetical protein
MAPTASQVKWIGNVRIRLAVIGVIVRNYRNLLSPPFARFPKKPRDRGEFRATLGAFRAFESQNRRLFPITQRDSQHGRTSLPKVAMGTEYREKRAYHPK